jgi:hypothetical protein
MDREHGPARNGITATAGMRNASFTIWAWTFRRRGYGRTMRLLCHERSASLTGDRRAGERGPRGGRDRASAGRTSSSEAQGRFAMGDKGKKDKDKGQKQKAKQHQQEDKAKQDKQPKKIPK